MTSIDYFAILLTKMNDELQQLTSQERLQAYELFVRGCTHIWGRDTETLKRGFKEAKALEVLRSLIPLTTKDPYFLAHLTSYIIQKNMGKDLKVFATFANSLSSADGQAFSAGSKYMKPNLRMVSASALQQLDPILALRVAEVAGGASGQTKVLKNFRAEVTELIPPSDSKDYWCVNSVINVPAEARGLNWIWFVKNLTTGDKIISTSGSDLTCATAPLPVAENFQPLTRGNFRGEVRNN